MSSKVSITIDGWCSRVFKSYIVITGHWIDSNWNMRSILLEFARFPSPHDGLAVHSIIKNCLLKWGIDKKVCSITS